MSTTAQYDANPLIDHVIGLMNLKNDAELARKLEVAPPVISKIRHNRLPVGATMLIKLHEVTEMSIKEIRSFIRSAV